MEGFVDHDETRKDSPWIENNQLLEIRVDTGVAWHGVVGGRRRRRHILILRRSGRRVVSDALDPSGDDTAHEHRPPAPVTAIEGVVGPTATGGGPYGYGGALEAVADDAADTAAGDGAAQAGGATWAEVAPQRAALEPQQLVTVGRTSRVLSGAAERTCFHRIAAVLEPLDRALGVVDL